MALSHEARANKPIVTAHQLSSFETETASASSSASDNLQLPASGTERIYYTTSAYAAVTSVTYYGFALNTVLFATLEIP